MNLSGYIKIIIILLAFLFFVSCEEKEDDSGFVYRFLCQYNIYTSSQEDHIIRDEGPYVVLASYVEDFSSCSNLVAKTWVLKKCLQGQVYREQEDDCKGSGDVSNLWGAQTYQYCPTNDISCETKKETDYGATLYYADPDSSPAAASCDEETLGGKKWSLPLEWRTANHSIILENLEGVAASDTIGFWALNYSESTDQAWAAMAVYTKDRFVIEEKPVPKNSFLYTICYSEDVK